MAILHFSHNLVTLGSAGGVCISVRKGWQTSAHIRQDRETLGESGCLMDGCCRELYPKAQAKL